MVCDKIFWLPVACATSECTLSGEFQDNWDYVAGGFGIDSGIGAIKSNTVKINEGTINAYVYGGRGWNGDISNNKVTISGGSINKAGTSEYGGIYGGLSWSEGPVYENEVVISGGIINVPVYGGESKLGEKNEVRVYENTITLSGGTVYGSLYGGYAEGSTQKNSIYLKGGTVSSDNGIWGGYAKGSFAENNFVEVSENAVVRSDVHGGGVDGGGHVRNNLVVVEGGKFDIEGKVISGGSSWGSGLVEKNKVLIRGGDISSSIYGGSGNGTGDVIENSIQITGGTLKNGVYGGISDQEASENTMTITGGKISTEVYGGSARGNGKADENIVDISDAEEITGDIFGGRSWGSGTANGNKVTVSGGTLQNSIYGGRSESGQAKDNFVTLSGTAFIDGAVYGGFSEDGNAFSGNTLVLQEDLQNPVRKAAGFNTVIFNQSDGNSLIKELDITAQVGNDTDADKFVHVLTNEKQVIFNSKDGKITGGSADGDGGFTVGGSVDGKEVLSDLVLSGTHDFSGMARILAGSTLTLGQNGTRAVLEKGSIEAYENSRLIFDGSKQTHQIGKDLIVREGAITYGTLDDRNRIAGEISHANEIIGDIDPTKSVVHAAGSVQVEKGAVLYVSGVNASNTYLFAYGDEGAATEDDGWRDENLMIKSTNVLLNLSRVNGDTDRKSVMISVSKDLPCADVPINLDQLVDAQLIDVDSQEPGVRFLSRATDVRYVTGGKDDMTSTINSAAHLANAGGVKHLSFAGSGLFGNAIDAHLSLSRTLELEDNVHLHLKEHQDLWVDVTGQRQKIKNISVCSGTNCKKPTEYGLDMDMGLIIVGLDRTFDENRHGGMAVMGGRGSTDSRGDFNSTSNTADMWGAAVYGGWDKDNWNVTGNATYTHIHSDVKQGLASSLQMGPRLDADITSHVWGLGIRGEYRYELSENFDLLPHLGLRWQRLTTTGFNTKAGGETVARTKRDHQNVWTVPVGIGFQGAYRTDSDWTIRPQADLSMLFSFGDLKDKTQVNFTGVNAWDTMQSRIVDKRTTAVNLGADVQKHNKSFGLSYSYMDSQHSSSHILWAKFVYRFGDYYEKQSHTNAFHFAFDKSGLQDLQDNGRQELDTVFDRYDEVLSVDISGHTDRLGKVSYNENLSAARAETIRKVILEKGIEPDKVTSAYYGASKPVVCCPDNLMGDELKACLQPNRRVDVKSEGLVNMEK